MDEDSLYTRADDLWFSDGTLVIRAETTIFRVTKSILAARSNVFKDMLAFPQGEGREAETIEGIPTVYLHDSAADVEVFLRAIFDSSYFMPAPRPVDIDVVLGILRLSHKYDVSYLLHRALEHLDVPFYFSSMETFLDSDSDHFIYRLDTGCLLRTIEAAKEVGALWLLPILYVRACQEDPADLTAAMASDTNGDAQKCVNGCFIFSREYSASLQFLANSTVVGCETPDSCTHARFVALVVYFKAIAQGDGLDPFKPWNWDYISRRGMCDGCLTFYKESREETLQNLWGRLPSIFDLPSWEELLALKTAAMSEASS
ncbi:hypothetical protein B0H17DRAFT_540935 [Mycena rosella]|uniref:BTB domain-containing protein n=1 Tax=Mycena rosella TaxID=1033263 RepID=A0AAD7DIC4_MYCRO|nr:hypothetical protein B0H17DRAFT_540935 [Mycena rosella]